MTYMVKEIIHTLQGEGAQTGRAAIFCRFAGCNLWSGRESDRAGAICTFCDTDFIGTDGQGGGKFRTADALANAINRTWPANQDQKLVVFTGGEPVLQLDTDLLLAIKRHRFDIAVETNGTLPVPENIDWICVSPKANAKLTQTSGHELKLVYPQARNSPPDFEHLQFQHWFLQPMDGPHLTHNTKLTIAYCRSHPRWRLSLQTHKLIGIP